MADPLRKARLSANKQSRLHGIGRELKDNPPRILSKTRKKFGPARAERQRKAILFSKFRRGG